MFHRSYRSIPAAVCVSSLIAVAGCSDPDQSATTTASTSDKAVEVQAQVADATTAATEDRTPPARTESAPRRDIDAIESLASTRPTDSNPGRNTEAFVVAEPAVLNLGTMATGQEKAGIVTLRNTGEAPMRIVDSRTSCGCTVANVPKGRELQPGETVDVDVSLRGGTRPEVLSKTVTFIIENQPNITVRVEGEAIAYVTIEPAVIDPERLPDGVIVVASQDEQPFRITSMQPQIGEFSNESKLEHEVVLDWERWEETGRPRRLLFYIDHPKTTQLTSAIRVPAPQRHADAHRMNESLDDRASQSPITRRISPVDMIKRGNLDGLLAAMEEDDNFDIETTDRTGMTLLGVASKEGKIEIMQALIDAGADIEAADRVGRSPLMQAAQSKNVEAVRLLLGAGADLDRRDMLGSTALSWAAGFGDGTSVQELIDTGARIEVVTSATGFTPLIWAAGFGEADSIRKLIAAGANVEAIDAIQNLTPLMHAARTGGVANVQALIEGNADIEAVDPEGRTVLLFAAGASGADAATVKALIDAGADVTAVDREGKNALDHAMMRDDSRRGEVVSLLEPLLVASSN